MPLRGATKLTFPRTRRVIPFEHGTTFDGGDLIPLHHQDILPGDTLKVRMSYVLRMLTPINPVMDNAYLSVDAYFVPYRIIWNQFKQFMGENDSTYWTESTTYTVPTGKYQPQLSSAGFSVGTVHSIGAYFGLPPMLLDDDNTDPLVSSAYSVSILPLRAYAQVYNYWYRNENVTPAVVFSKESVSSTSVGSTAVVLSSTNFSYMAKPLKSEKLPDYFTMLLPQPQKGDEQLVNGIVNASSVRHDAGSALSFVDDSLNPVSGNANIVLSAGLTDYLSGDEYEGSLNFLRPDNLWANIGVSALRDAIFRQHVLEIRAKAGSRYASETLPSLFGVENSEALLSEAEYLGGFDKLINMTEVLSNSDTTTDDGTGRPVGANGAMSKTTGDGYIFNHTFSEHGLVIILATVRHRETYFQGIERRWNRLSFWDWYLPQAQGLGMQPVYKRELNIAGLADTDRSIFGYRDYGADYTFFPNRLSGYLNPILGTNGLATWSFGSVLTRRPVLNSAFMKADDTGFARTLVLQDVNEGMQFFGDFAFELDLTSVACNSQRFPGMDRI